MRPIKKLVENIPPAVGVPLNRIPFSLRLGRNYCQKKSKIQYFLDLNDRQKEIYVEKSFGELVKYFSENSDFFRSLLPNNLNQSYLEFPIISKTILKSVGIDERTVREFAFAKFNTGGTSGRPMDFFLEKGYYAREWSHMHFLWERIGYKYINTKITIRGKKLHSLIQYNYNQNEFLLDAYAELKTADFEILLKVFKKYKPTFIHGYPSSIFYFIKTVELKFPALFEYLQKNIKGIMFSSEYPSPQYRNYIENTITENTVSWYGHTEAVVLAGELYKKYEYVPFLSYGFAEAVKINGSYHLIGTCFSNKATPFIRYDTEDLIEPNFSNNGYLNSFKIKEGRIGEFVIDKNGNLISLTGLIFGQHHKLFDYIDFLQVKQPTPGKLIVYYSSKLEIQYPDVLFDTRNMQIDFSFEQYKQPIKTSLGKVPLLIK